MLRAIRPSPVFVLAFELTACSAAHPRFAATPPLPIPGAKAEGAPGDRLEWAEFGPETFARAKAQHRFIVLDGAAEWCHWCHVMEATTYHDPTVRQLLAERFIAAKVDVDSRPDIEERYGAWGWPATVIFSADGAEVGKYKGYIDPATFAEALRAVLTQRVNVEDATPPTAPSAETMSGLPEEEIAWIARVTELELAEYWDSVQGSWGHGQKVPLSWDNAWALERARAGDGDLRDKVFFALDQQAQIIDPVWGGIYQYSTDGDWRHPHFEKLTRFQAGALDNYATAYALTHDARRLDAAKAIDRFIESFMTSDKGVFYATMDADLNAHDPTKAFMSGRDYYARSDAERRILGLPRIDTHDYGTENGLMIAAYVTFYQATLDPHALDMAKRAARLIIDTHLTGRGAVTHDHVDEGARLFLADNAAFGWALTRLYEATHDTEWLGPAKRIADFLGSDLFDEKAGGFWSATLDPNAIGVFAVRRKPFEDNVLALRFLARLAKQSPAEGYRTLIARTLRAVATPDQIKDRGRMLGDFLLALDETKGCR
jgi:uncharacterized protein YyaL (SSP411 family)